MKKKMKGRKRESKKDRGEEKRRHSEKNGVNGLKFLWPSSRPVGVAGV